MPSSRYTAIQNAIFLAIEKPHFGAALPPLSEEAWLKILQHNSRSSHDENERLEFLGDALMYSTLGRELYKQIPDGTPGLYTDVRAALHSNATFSRLAEKLDILAVSRKVLDALTRRTFGEGSSAPSKSRGQIKATADLFETVIGAYYMEQGFERLCQWVAELYAPLISVGKRAFLDYVRDNKKRSFITALPQHCVGLISKKPRVAATPPKRKRTRVRTPVYSPLKSKLSMGPRPHAAHKSDNASRTVAPRTSLRHSLTTSKLSHAKPKPILIDLTALDDDSDDQSTFRPVKTASSTLPTSPVLKPVLVPVQMDRAGKIKRDSDDSDDEQRLEDMLLGGSYSDMDLCSSDLN
ncbi:ribonuclease III [Trametopsis cervina]|nr:ribonuclease III [Trametopsis cervina]